MSSLTDVLTDLEILSMVHENEKFCCRDGKISIETKGHPIRVALRRWLNNDSRKSMLLEINNIINRAISMSKESTDEWVQTQFLFHFKRVIGGLENIKKTYFDDSTVVARLNVIISMLEEIIKKMSSIVSKEYAGETKRPDPTTMEKVIGNSKKTKQ